MPRVAAIVLAAGASTRLGHPKQMVRLDTGPEAETLLERTVRTAREAGCAPVIVVLGCRADTILAASQLQDAEIVLHNGWAEGMASSIQAGLEPLRTQSLTGVVVMTCDQPAVSASHLRRLFALDEVQASSYAGRRGVPAYFPARTFAHLLLLRGDQGARTLLQHARTEELAGGELDVDTQEALAEARLLFGKD